jgi:hypothetical protein
MHRRTAGRATAAAAALALACTGVAVADSVYGDADTVTAGVQGFINLGTVAAGSTRQVEVGFELACLGLAHVDPGVVVTLTPTVTPATGGSMAATPATIGPVPADWPADGEPCVGDPVARGSTTSEVSITAPGTVGNHVFRVSYAKSPAGGLTGSTVVQLLVSVAANTAPALDLPADMVVEGNAPGGWAADFVATASDAEDDPDPGVDCNVASGEVLPLGTTTVSCAATDQGGATTSGSFTVTVVDTTPPALAAPADISVETADPAGTMVEYPVPAAADVVDPLPAVACDPPSGSTLAPGATLVTCTATDASGNAAAVTFTATVTVAQRGPALTGSWQRPLRPGTPALVGNPGRTIPLRLVVIADARVAGPGSITAPTLRIERLAACAADAAVIVGAPGGAFAWTDGAWQRNLDTAGLGGCVRVSGVVEGDVVADAILRLVQAPGMAKRSR